MAESDRVVSLWDAPSPDSNTGKMVASVQLDSDARHVSLSTSASILLILSASGKVTVYPIPEMFAPPVSSNRTQPKLPTLLPRSTLSVSPKKNSGQVVAVSFVEGAPRSIRVARILGVKPVFDVLVSVFQIWRIFSA
jgi:U3 small nucleolar RNA-associated protein 5